MSLKEQLVAINKQAGEVLPQEVLDKFGKFAEYVKGLDIESKCLQVGDAAPSFTLPAASGGDYVLADGLAKGPVIALFFRGRW